MDLWKFPCDGARASIAPARAERVEHGHQLVARHDVQHHVRVPSGLRYFAFRGQGRQRRGQPFGCGRLLTCDHSLCTEVPDSLGLRRAGDPQDVRAEVGAHLHEGRPDAAGRARDNHAFALLDPCALDHVPRRLIGSGEAGELHHLQLALRWDRNRIGGGDDAVRCKAPIDFRSDEFAVALAIIPVDGRVHEHSVPLQGRLDASAEREDCPDDIGTLDPRE
mmetsp:Transcript_32625/g.79377  ORF Transcript_32625/g.79377 Transcript_32625/m.79377 type:complete len:221 (-) Transcript_32625:251-913(-)